MIRNLSIVLLTIVFLFSCSSKQRPSELIVPDDKPASQKLKNIEVALVLGGGGSRGIAHAGVIEVLEENNIPIDIIVGSSAGSAVGAIYADTKNSKETKNILFRAKTNEILDFSIIDFLSMLHTTKTPVVGQAYENFIFENLKAKTFDQLKIPLAVVTVDTITGQKFIIDSGPIAPAVRASSAIPPIIAPVKLYGKLLFDGGILEPVPVDTAKNYSPKITIAVDISTLPPKTEAVNALDLTYRALWFSYFKLARTQSRTADIDIYIDLDGHGTFEDNRKEELYQAGRKAALEMIPVIKAKLNKITLSKNLRK